MTLREAVKQNRYELSDGIQWVAFYKTGRSWESVAFCPDDVKDGEPIFSDEDAAEIEQIMKYDRNAVLLNGYYHNIGANEDGTARLDDLIAGVQWQYDLNRSRPYSND